jgi:hypothetical protein
MHSKARKVGLQRLRPATNHAGDIRNRLRVLHEHSVAQDQLINLIEDEKVIHEMADKMRKYCEEQIQHLKKRRRFLD